MDVVVLCSEQAMMKTMISWWVWVVVCCWVYVLPVEAAILSGRCVGVTDGDTITLLTQEQKQVKVRLHGIDAPERSQDYGMVAKRRLSELVFNQSLQVEYWEQDRYGRVIGRLWKKGADINLQMIREGLAWHYAKYAPQEYAYAQAQAEANSASRGLWVAVAPTPPWEYRAGNRPQAPNPNDWPYWVTEGGKIHNEECKYFGSTQVGYYTAAPQGENCTLCGGEECPEEVEPKAIVLPLASVFIGVGLVLFLLLFWGLSSFKR